MGEETQDALPTSLLCLWLDVFCSFSQVFLHLCAKCDSSCKHHPLLGGCRCQRKCSSWPSSRSQKSSLAVKRKDAVNTVAAWISCDWPWRGAEPGFWITKLLHCSVYRKVLTVCLSVRSFPLPAHYSLCCRLGWHGGQRANSHKTNKRISCFSQLKTTFCKLASAHNVGNGTMLF